MSVLVVFIRPIEGKSDNWTVSQMRRDGGEAVDCRGHGAALEFVKMLAFTHPSMLVITYSRRDKVESLEAFKSGRWRSIPLE